MTNYYEDVNGDLTDLILKVGASFYLHEYYQDKLIYIGAWQ
jgi:hypothetical protein